MAILNTVRFMRVGYDSAGRVLIAWHKLANSVHSLPNAQASPQSKDFVVRR